MKELEEKEKKVLKLYDQYKDLENINISLEKKIQIQKNKKKN